MSDALVVVITIVMGAALCLWGLRREAQLDKRRGCPPHEWMPTVSKSGEYTLKCSKCDVEVGRANKNGWTTPTSGYWPLP